MKILKSRELANCWTKFRIEVAVDGMQAQDDPMVVPWVSFYSQVFRRLVKQQVLVSLREFNLIS